MNQFIKNLKTPIAIVGMGKSGDSAKRLLIACGVSADKILTFDGKLESANFRDSNKLMSEGKPQTLVVSPGVPLSSAWIKEAKSHGVFITSEISLACSCLSTEKLIGVTGSVGKSTTVSLLQAGLEAFSKTGFVGGNLGIPFATYAADVLEKKRPVADWVVLELSSYQLENCEGLKLDYSAITYFTSNHLERYDSIEHYYQTKWNILGITKNKMLVNSEGGDLVEYSKAKQNAQVKVISKKDSDLQSYQLEKAQLIGQHNQDNMALATALTIEAGWPAIAIEGMKNFKGLSHRLENLGEVKGVRFINDSKATALDSVMIAATAAADTLSAGGVLYLLLGGRDKNLPWEQLASLKDMKNTVFVFFGECREVAQTKSALQGNSYARLEEAIGYIFGKVKAADTVLLSPGGTSLDEFKSFEDRGDFFKRKVSEFSTL
ncbi:UDP-N-acetylmuramoyl-L-alanine--D-glutamate ligase [Bdellovibrio sp. SKB1291214]|uniref:UDP-N-acetylmuramoyl-L-alanine--D-glutamate ligase n=1 Tax=Bdellovibrio sp. SKB1291214 TaxID=1732569 RepID=UPI00223F57B9|nr:UDP-N-acetylmuramoyl-L-alanine--D-glutamate ligase [Bdellovibrio sp. SKB1291214]UYL10503.1 UDP-N-acetylmuramoyl-L-alanine--D-glutamate ligase [Bdellovibrio sp. SKB1291214]